MWAQQGPSELHAVPWDGKTWNYLGYLGRVLITYDPSLIFSVILLFSFSSCLSTNFLLYERDGTGARAISSGSLDLTILDSVDGSFLLLTLANFYHVVFFIAVTALQCCHSLERLSSNAGDTAAGPAMTSSVPLRLSTRRRNSSCFAMKTDEHYVDIWPICWYPGSCPKDIYRNSVISPFERIIYPFCGISSRSASVSAFASRDFLGGPSSPPPWCQPSPRSWAVLHVSRHANDSLSKL